MHVTLAILSNATCVKELMWTDQSSIPHTPRSFLLFFLFVGCDTAFGLSQGVIEDSALSASSFLNQAHAASEGRLNGATGWCASDGDKEMFFTVRIYLERKQNI